MKKVFFTSSTRGKKQLLSNYQRIYSLITELGYKHTFDFPYDNDEAYYSDNSQNRQDSWNREVSALKKADVVVIEASVQSFGNGYLLNLALNLEKPTLVLHLKDYKSVFVDSITDDRLQIIEYCQYELKQILDRELFELTHLPDQRFTLLLPKDIVDYLHDVAETGRTRSDYIRKLIREDIIKRNKPKQFSQSI